MNFIIMNNFLNQTFLFTDLYCYTLLYSNSDIHKDQRQISTYNQNHNHTNYFYIIFADGLIDSSPEREVGEMNRWLCYIHLCAKL